MKRYYFFKPSKYRQDDKQKSIISFELCALYAENATYASNGKKTKRFNYIDQISLSTSTANFNYTFDIDTGINGCKSHHAKSYKEFLAAKTDSGYTLVSERDYNRLRLLAFSLLFRTLKKRQSQNGDNKFAWTNDSYSGAWNFEIANSNYQYNRMGYSAESIERLGYLNDCAVSEYMKIIVFKGDYKSYTFRLHTYPYTPSYRTHEDLFSRFLGGYNNNDTSEISQLQYNRLRKLAVKLIFDYSDLDIADLKHKQVHSIAIL